MNKKNKILSISGIVLIVVIITAYLVFSDSTICTGVEVEIAGDENEYIIDAEDIKRIIFDEYKDLLGNTFDSVDLSSLERKIESHPSVKSAEVYKKISGVLAVKLEQKIPVVRIMPLMGHNFYLDEDGALLPVSKIGTARVPVVNGNVKYIYKGKSITVYNDTTITETLKGVYAIGKKISEDSFLKAQIEQIYVKSNGEYELIPKVGNHIVLLGDIYNFEKKLDYLKHFYLNVLKKEGWRTYNYINLKYKNQLVCTKNNE